MYYGSDAPSDASGGRPAGEGAGVPVSEETPQFRDISIRGLVCRGARKAILLQGLPEMPIRGIHLQDVAITAESGVACMDAKDVVLKDVEIACGKGPVLDLVRTTDVLIDRLAYPAGADAVVEVRGAGNRDIVIKRTDLNAAARDFILTDGATPSAFRVE
jgi:hypothetical protein